MKFKSLQLWIPPLNSPITKIALLISSLVFILFFVVFQLTEESIRPTHIATNPLSFLSFLNPKKSNSQSTIIEEMLLTDTEPIFLPTTFSACTLPGHPLPITPDNDFFSIRPRIQHLNTNTLSDLIASPLPTIHTPTEAFDLHLSSFTDTFGSNLSAPSFIEPVVSPLYLQVSSISGSTNPIVFNLPTIPHIKKDNLFSPCEFYILIHNHSIVGDIRMLTTSGQEDLDDQLKSFLLTYPEIINLEDGYYKLTVGS